MKPDAATTDPGSQSARRLTLTGKLQGIGVRPAVARFAKRLGLVGYVANTRRGVEIHIAGAVEQIERFERECQAQLPAAATVSSLECERTPALAFEAFTVLSSETVLKSRSKQSESSQTTQPLIVPIPTDWTACKACLAEANDRSDRRYQYPFISCTDCGPRYSLIEQMPYERGQTGMAGFSLCKHCAHEYQDGADRRFHAQTIACPDCGPHVWLRNKNNHVLARRGDAIHAAAHAIRAGQIVALRGLGGYQLLVDATAEHAVARLRERKRRFGKPLAVMAASIVEATRIACLSAEEQQLLASRAGPIVVASVREDANLAASVSNGLGSIGVMAPSTPLHSLLLNAVRRVVVCTSANRESEPIVYDDRSALSKLGNIADVWLEHDRPINNPIDDSVVRMIAARPVTLRLARGYAPLSLALKTNQPLLAVGGQQKAAIALSNTEQSVLANHIGDLSNVAAGERFFQQLGNLSELYGISAVNLVCDQHPEYFSRQWVERQSNRYTSVQHHHAHIVAGMLENGWLDRQVLGVGWDGSGYGSDGSVWGGEFLLATSIGFQRVGALRPFRLAGGDRAVREPWRVATALVRESVGEDVAARLKFRTGDPEAILSVLRRPRLSVSTTSAGRLFDGVAALVLGVEQCQFEGQAAMLLESSCDSSAAGRYEIPLRSGAVRQLDWRPLVRQILVDQANHASPGEMAIRFHRGLANAIYQFCRIYDPLPIVLGGGVFQNQVLVELLAEIFVGTTQSLGLPGIIPPNDGGLAAGQLAIAAAQTQLRSD